MSGIEQQATVVDDYLRDEASNVSKAVTAIAATEGEPTVTTPAMKETESENAQQQCLPLDEPDQNGLPPLPSAGAESARGESAGKTP